jgi:hypothetical protein
MWMSEDEKLRLATAEVQRRNEFRAKWLVVIGPLYKPRKRPKNRKNS